MKKWIPIASGLMAGFVAATISFADFSKNTNTEVSSATNKSDAEKVYVPFGEKDDYYLFASGGHSGQMFIYGVPSMRQIRTVPVFSQDSATGYGFDEHSKKMMGDYTWGDLHHPAFSETNGDYDGKYMFATDVGNSRAAVMDLETFTTKDILKVPNTADHTVQPSLPKIQSICSCQHGLPFHLAKNMNLLMTIATKYRGVMSAVTFDEKNTKVKYCLPSCSSTMVL